MTNEPTERGVIVAEALPPMTIIPGASTPQEVVAGATEMANVLAKIIEDKKLYLQIGTKKHVYVEGWTTLGTMCSLAPHIEWTRAVDDGWEARCEIRRLSNGMALMGADAQCTRQEKNWRTRDDFMLRSMAQTRATSKAFRLVLSWIMVLGGYDATPAEETDGAAARTPRRPAGIGAEESKIGENQIKAIRASLAQLFAKDEQKQCEWMTQIQPKAVEGTEIHLGGLTQQEAADIIVALNDERAGANNAKG